LDVDRLIEIDCVGEFEMVGVIEGVNELVRDADDVGVKESVVVGVDDGDCI
jgi:hypothetical protein